MKYAFLIAGTETGVGKTTVVLSLIAHFKKQNYSVQSFKCGPDFIDPIVHQKINNRPCINLDSVLMSEDHIKYLVNKYSEDADIVIIEGVMGMFDGSGKGLIGSSSHISQILSIPVILVLDASRLAKTVGAILYGFKYYDPMAEMRAVIFNHINSEEHYKILKESAEEVNVKALGYIKDDKKIKIEERYLGLNYESNINRVKDNCENTLVFVNTEDLLEVSTNYFYEKTRNTAEVNKKYKIAIACDEAFQFLYQENIAILEEIALLHFFSPLKNEKIPNDIDMLYLPGGYPENYLTELLETDFYKELNEVHNKNKIILAECGGMMILGRSVKKGKNKVNTANLFDYEIEFNNKISISYAEIYGHHEFNGLRVAAHEFHFSSLKLNKDGYSNQFSVRKNEGDSSSEIFYKNNCFASYFHIYWAEKRSFIKRLFLSYAKTN